MSSENTVNTRTHKIVMTTVVILASLLVVMAVALFVASSRANPTDSYLYIASSISARNEKLRFTVDVDGHAMLENVNESALQMITLHKGTHVVTVRVPGYTDYSETINATPNGGELYMYADMKPIKCSANP